MSGNTNDSKVRMTSNPDDTNGTAENCDVKQNCTSEKRSDKKVGMQGSDDVTTQTVTAEKSEDDKKKSIKEWVKRHFEEIKKMSKEQWDKLEQKGNYISLIQS